MNFRSNFDSLGVLFGVIASVCASNSENTFLASGYSHIDFNNNSLHSHYIARYSQNGLIDSTYGDDGYVSLNELNTNFNFNTYDKHLMPLEDGNTLFWGICRDTVENKIYHLAAAYNSEGLQINEFGNDGLFLKEIEGSLNISPVPLQFEDGFISLIKNDTNHLSLIKVNYEGLIDSSFGTNGIVPLNDVLFNLQSFNVLYKNNDSTLFVINNLNNESNGRIKLYTTDGELVTTFGQDGEFELNIPGYHTKIQSIVPISETEFISVIETINEENYMNNLYTVKLVSSSQASPTLIQENTTLIASAPNATSYQWYINGVEIINANDSTFTYTNNGVYSVKFTDIHGCEYSIGSGTITDVGLKHVGQTEFNIFPNPSNGQFSISNNNPNEKFTIYNAIGKQIADQIQRGELFNIETPGLYFVVAENGNTRKLVIH